ncbi:MAG: hypothetical protein HBSAPP03_25920 [Phycisphaerae bacterium]|nr:MAG: hypothetical protein HBSAPP03_25920 [Phycisphaerae bacterium]
MSQFGMQMAGGRVRRAASPDVYTALAVVATIFLVAALVVMFNAGSRVGKGGSPFGLQDAKRIELPK